MKYIEMVKSIILMVLIGMSLVLTFLIWNSSPYETMGNRATVETMIAETPEKKDIDDMIKPYKIHFTFDESYKGTTDVDHIDYMLEFLKKWRMENPVLEDREFSQAKLNELLRSKNSIVFYYSDEVPLPVYESALSIENANIPEVSFRYVVVEWDMSRAALEIHFISKENGVRYTSAVKRVDAQSFFKDIVNVAKSYEDYAEVRPGSMHFIVVPTDEVHIVQNTYFPNEKDEINPTRFRNVLFNDPNAIRRSAVGAHRETFQDNHALMTIDTEKKQLQFVHPSVESYELAIPSELLEDAIDFINDHGGWTDEYRFSKMNFKTRYVNFKLYVRGIAVLGSNTPTEIEEVWGDDTIYQYRRPYYTLGDTLPSEAETITLPSGTEVAEALKKVEGIEFGLVEEILPAYYLHQDVELNIFKLEPSWFYKYKGNWIRFSLEQAGGENVGLE